MLSWVFRQDTAMTGGIKERNQSCTTKVKYSLWSVRVANHIVASIWWIEVVRPHTSTANGHLLRFSYIHNGIMTMPESSAETDWSVRGACLFFV